MILEIRHNATFLRLTKIVENKGQHNIKNNIDII